MSNNFDEMIEKIKENRYKTPIEITKPYIDKGYKFCGAYTSPEGYKGKKTICCDCGFSNTFFLMENIAEIKVCGRCGGSNIYNIPIKDGEVLNKKVTDALVM